MLFQSFARCFKTPRTNKCTMCIVWTVRVDIAILDSLNAATQVCSINIPVTPLNVTQRDL